MNRVNPFAPPKLPPSAKKQDKLKVRKPEWAEEVEHDPFAPSVMGAAQGVVEGMDDTWGKAAMRYMSPYAQGAATFAGLDKLLPLIIEEAVRMGKSGFELPGDVLLGKTDPRSDEAIARGIDLVGLMGSGTLAMGPRGTTLGAMGAKGAKRKPRDYDTEFESVAELTDPPGPVPVLKNEFDNLEATGGLVGSAADINDAYGVLSKYNWDVPTALTNLKTWDKDAYGPVLKVVEQFAKKQGIDPDVNPFQVTGTSPAPTPTQSLPFPTWKAVKDTAKGTGYSQDEFLATLKDIGPGWEKVFDKFSDKQVGEINKYLGIAAQPQKPKIIPPDEWDLMTPAQKQQYDEAVEAWMNAPGKLKYWGKTWDEMDPALQQSLIDEKLANPDSIYNEPLGTFLKESLSPEDYARHFEPKAPQIRISPEAEAAGYTTPVFHGTGRWNTPDFEEFNPLLGDGMHVGTHKAAHDILLGNFQQGARIIPLLARIKNPLHLATDMGAWRDPGRWVEKLSHTDDWGSPPPGARVFETTNAFGDRRRVWPNEEGAKLPEEHWEALMKLSVPLQYTSVPAHEFIPKLGTTLKELGYDAIAYVNNVEDKGSISYMLFDSAQVKVPWARKFDPTDARIIEAGGFPIFTIETETEEPDWGNEIPTPFGPAVEVDEEPQW
jgi:hypothetical protein